MLSQKSLANLSTCDRRLHDLFLSLAEICDFVVIEGHRGEEAQNKAFERGASKLKWPNGKHNKFPSVAVDVAPTIKKSNGQTLIEWNRIEAFKEFADIVMRKAAEMEIGLIWGGDWDGDPKTKNNFNDLVHFELKFRGK